MARGVKMCVCVCVCMVHVRRSKRLQTDQDAAPKENKPRHLGRFLCWGRATSKCKCVNRQDAHRRLDREEVCRCIRTTPPPLALSLSASLGPPPIIPKLASKCREVEREETAATSGRNRGTKHTPIVGRSCSATQRRLRGRTPIGETSPDLDRATRGGGVGPASVPPRRPVRDIPCPSSPLQRGRSRGPGGDMQMYI